jgi:PAS domain S-box-containing protein
MPELLRVLIVEDSPDDAELMALRLAESEYLLEWRRVETEAEYLAEIEKATDLVLADWSLPKFSGLRAFELARERGLEIPFVIVSGSIGEESAVEALHLGVQDYVLKDRISRLGMAVRRALENHRNCLERRQAEAALVQSENRYRLLADNTVDVIWTMDTEFTFTYVNPSIAELTGYTPEEWIGARLQDHCDHENLDKMTQAIQKAFAALPETKGITLDAQILHRDGKPVPVEITGKILLDANGQPGALQGVARDITQRLSLENQLRQAQKMESVGRLAGGVAHDFNNMLSVIIGHAQMAMETVDPGQPVHEHLEEVIKAAQRSTNLTRQLLAYARRQVVKPQVLDLNDTVSGMFKMLQRLIGENIHLIWKPGAALWPVFVDPTQIDQILANLAVNARDAIGEQGAITLETQNVTLDETYGAAHAGFVPGDYVLLAVSDSGMGMDQETLGHIFEPFFTTKPESEGTGLGLATVYGIVKQNDGFVNVYSESGQGTSFKVYLPRTGTAIEQAADDSTTPPTRGTETVLLVEDEPTVLKLAQTILERHGYKVLAAPTPLDALALADSHQGPIHLLVTDVIMPEMNGKELRDRLLKVRPDLKTLFMSGYTANVIAHHGIIEAGIHFIQKPFSIQTLTAQMREALKQ